MCAHLPVLGEQALQNVPPLKPASGDEELLRDEYREKNEQDPTAQTCQCKIPEPAACTMENTNEIEHDGRVADHQRGSRDETVEAGIQVDHTADAPALAVPANLSRRHSFSRSFSAMLSEQYSDNTEVIVDGENAFVERHFTVKCK